MREFFFLAVNTGFSSNGLPTEKCIHFYRERSGNNIDCSIVGNVVIPGGYGTNDVCATISGDDSWKSLAKAIKNNGSRAGIQLSSTWSGYTGNRRFVPLKSADPIMDYKQSAAKYSRQNIIEILSDIKLGVHYSIEAGFDHIQFHCAHGYLFSLLIDPEFCKYSSLFQSGLETIINELKSQEIETSIRFSLITGAHRLDKSREQLIDEIMSLPFDYFDPSFGFYNINKNLIYPVTQSALNSRHNKTLKLASNYPMKKVILSGKSLGLNDSILPENVHIGLCRDLIANPKYLIDRKNGCKNCDKCHYYSNNKTYLECGVLEV